MKIAHDLLESASGEVWGEKEEAEANGNTERFEACCLALDAIDLAQKLVDAVP